MRHTVKTVTCYANGTSEIAEFEEEQGAQGRRAGIVYGERRYWAAVMANLAYIPAFVREMSDAEAEDVAITENLQCEDVRPLEEAAAYSRALESGRHTVESLIGIFDKSEGRSCMHNTANQVLFLDCTNGCAGCQNMDCMIRKNEAFLKQKAIDMLHNDPRIVLTADDDAPQSVIEALLEEGYHVESLEKSETQLFDYAVMRTLGDTEEEFRDGKFIASELFIGLCIEHGIEIQPRTLGTLRKRIAQVSKTHVQCKGCGRGTRTPSVNGCSMLIGLLTAKLR